ncbi:PREDICTED: uncharacterized protein LOC105568196 isoform X1 [Vollenhovia emeryi]|uniref:uncharacterized protein LOC105568196 isoform X1 n=1 Tax=Vollenhovia emeryi TaxID=411798 RepID=UPI0005F3BB5B|nr:PREDICTED: uncharacterized protein LOC105568196 isoform X1 [Vollenhovia emeryi]XP_011879061.1 PREDICTED: uncharacterized protein LOC105568196 isoform X1 [Vollenhovia emeryi]
MAGRSEKYASPKNIDKEMLHTCSVCKSKVVEEEICNHPCLRGYEFFYVDENLIFHPQNQNDDEQSLVDDSHMSLVDDSEEMDEIEKQVPKKIKKTIETWHNEKHVQEEQLIDEIHKRPALWNFKLPLAERSIQIKKKLWEEVSASINNMDIATVKKKWKSLCDSFRIQQNKQYRPSGSAATSQTNKWVHFDRMQFLSDVQLTSKTATNISRFESNEELHEDYDDDSRNSILCDDNSSSGRGSRGSKRRSTSISDNAAIDRIANALNQPVTVKLPSSSPPDKIMSFANLIAAQLREIDPQDVDEVMIQLLQVLNTAKKRHL